MSISFQTTPQDRSRWRTLLVSLRLENARLIGGSLIMLIGSGMVSAINFGYNVAVARLLGPVGFGHAAAAVTLLMLVSAITLAFQLVCAKFIARNETPGGKAEVYSALLRRAWMVSISLGAGLIMFSGQVAHYLNLPAPHLVILLALGVAFYIPLGVRRGGLQGLCCFRRLTANFILEALVRFLGAIVLIEIGYGITGAIGAIAASVMLAYFLPPTPRGLQVAAVTGLPASFREGIQAIVFFVGQVIINNIDILLVKHFFPSDLAGVYAAVALVGRVLYFLSWSVVSAMFPISAGAKHQDERVSVVIVPLVIVLAMSVAFTLGLGLFPNLVLRAIFGAGFGWAGHRFDSLLTLYAAATGVYSLAVVLMAYEMSRKLANSGWIQLAFSVAIVTGINLFHSSLHQVIIVQLVLMVVLLGISSLPFFRLRNRGPVTAGTMPVTDFIDPVLLPVEASPSQPVLKRLGRVSEAEVIAEFLKNEFYQTEFQRDRDRFEQWVMNPDLSNEAENALRRALLFRRRETMWRELPHDTEWWEVQITPADLDRIRVFPRAQWRKMASGNFMLKEIVERIRRGAFKKASSTSHFISKLMALSSRVQFEQDCSAILLIGVDEQHSLTIIEGNHRVTAAALVSPDLAVQRFRYICGFSAHMTECCWYQTSLTTLWRYGLNRIKVLMYDREAEIARLVLHHKRGLSDSEGSDARVNGGAPRSEAPAQVRSANQSGDASDILRREAS